MKCPLCEAFLTDTTLLGAVGIFIWFRCNHCGEDFAFGFHDADLLTVADIPGDED